jgi:hypothetical protein
MLSFLREQGAGDLPDGPDAGDVKQADSQEYLTVAANRKNLRRSTIGVMILVAIGLAGLAFMIHRSQPQAASAEPVDDEAQIEVAISRLTGVSAEMVNRMDEIVKRFYEFSDVFQVGVGELAKNPFEVEVFAEAIKEDGGKADNERAQAALLERENLKKRAGTLKLLSVMRSEEGNCCMINDRILSQGDIIEGFAIVSIRGDSVDLIHPLQIQPDDVQDVEVLKVTLRLAQ